MPIVLLERGETESTYAEDGGEPVCLPNPEWGDSVTDLWRMFDNAANWSDPVNDFIAWLDLSESGRDAVFCDECGRPSESGDMTETLDENHVCERCLRRDYSYCDECEGYYADSDYDAHAHPSEDNDDSTGCCDAPQQNFRIRNDGNGMLDSDTPVTVTLPSGIISPQGMVAIGDYLLDEANKQARESGRPSNLYSLAYDVELLGNEWQNKQGNFTKRLSKLAYTSYLLKLTPAVLSAVGNIARDHSKEVNFDVEVTRKLNNSAGYFYHADSCWWQSYSASRCVLKSNGGFGLRSFRNDHVSGRAWVMPLKRKADLRLTPTFNTETPDAFVVFNGYGDLQGYAPARLLAHMAGFTYKKLAFDLEGAYVNSGSGYLVAPEDIAADVSSLDLYVSAHSSLFSQEQSERTINVA